MRNFLILLVLMIAVFGAATTEASAKVVGPKPRMVNLWGIKPQGSTKTIGQLWNSVPTYKYTCVSQKITFSSGKSYQKAVFWPAFHGPNTLVSTDTKCLITESAATRKTIAGLLKEPNLFQYITGEPFEDEGLVGFPQYRAYQNPSPALTCRARGLGVLQLETDAYVELYYQNTIFQANNLKSVFGIRSWVSRDMTCTSDNSVIAKWKADPAWTYTVWFEGGY
jgi:hypothetical protein